MVKGAGFGSFFKKIGKKVFNTVKQVSDATDIKPSDLAQLAGPKGAVASVPLRAVGLGAPKRAMGRRRRGGQRMKLAVMPRSNILGMGRPKKNGAVKY